MDPQKQNQQNQAQQSQNQRQQAQQVQPTQQAAQQSIPQRPTLSQNSPKRLVHNLQSGAEKAPIWFFVAIFVLLVAATCSIVFWPKSNNQQAQQDSKTSEQQSQIDSAKQAAEKIVAELKEASEKAATESAETAAKPTETAANPTETAASPTKTSEQPSINPTETSENSAETATKLNELAENITEIFETKIAETTDDYEKIYIVFQYAEYFYDATKDFDQAIGIIAKYQNLVTNNLLLADYYDLLQKLYAANGDAARANEFAENAKSLRASPYWEVNEEAEE